MTNRDLDIVIFGATGYTGKLIVERIAKQYGVNKGLRWAIAGRSQEAMDALKSSLELPQDLPTITAHSDDPTSLAEMAAKTRICLSVVGPYQKFGSELVAACVRHGTDYLDLCGEPVWMRQMIDVHEAEAQWTGARILFSCGFDSIPFELGVYALQNQAFLRTDRPVQQVYARVKMAGKFSVGTLASVRASQQGKHGFGASRIPTDDPFVLTPGFSGSEQPDLETVRYDEVLRTWTSPYIMAPINSRNIHRSNYLQGFRYGKNFLYDERMMTGPGDPGEAAARALNVSMKSLLSKEPEPGDNPTTEQRDAGSYSVHLYGQASDGTTIVATVASEKDPGYGSTSQLVVETALCLLHSSREVAGRFWTPIAALKDSLPGRLTAKADITLEVSSVPPSL